jgi:hypothetical protein
LLCPSAGYTTFVPITGEVVEPLVLGRMEALKTRIPLEQLVYELLDAHQDTVELAEQLVASPEWEIHCAYLRDLQRVGREHLAAGGA